MACSHNLQRRLLLSIIRAPPRIHQPFSEFSHVQSRSIHATRWSQSQGFSISFGPEIDELLYPEKKRKKTSGDSSSGSGRSRKTNTRTNSSNVSTLEIQETHGQNSSRPARTDSQRQQIQDELTNGSHGHTDTSMLSSDQTTIELSEDAYVTISKSESTNRPLSKSSPKQSGTTSGAARRQSGGREASVHNIKKTMSNLQPRKRSEQWQVQKDALQKKFGDDGWNPRKKLSPDAMEGIRSLHEQDPDRYTTPMLAQQFKMSPEAIRRILKSKWRPSEEGMEERRERWARRHDRIWDQKAALGLRPARRTIREVEGPEAFEEEMKAKQALGQI